MSVAIMRIPDDSSEPIDLDKISNEELDQLAMSMTANFERHVKMLGMIYIQCEKRGRDVTQFRKLSMYKWIRAVGQGVLSEQAFSAYYGRLDILRCMSSLSMPTQNKLIEAKSVPVLDKTDGKDTHRLIEISEMTPEEVRLVFDTNNHKVRTPDEQAKFLAACRVKEKIIRAEITHDDRTGLIDSKRASFAQIRAYAQKNGLS